MAQTKVTARLTRGPGGLHFLMARAKRLGPGLSRVTVRMEGPSCSAEDSEAAVSRHPRTPFPVLLLIKVVPELNRGGTSHPTAQPPR